MKSILLIFIILVSSTSQFFPLIASSFSSIEPDVVDYSAGNHTVESFHFTQKAAYTFVDDGSIWQINPEDTNWIEQDRKYLTNILITLMPEAGTDHYPVRIIVHNFSWYGWKDFTVSLVSAPASSETTLISSLDQEGGAEITIKISSKKGTEKLALQVNPLDAETVKRWKVGQKVISGGVWFPQYDPYGRRDYSCNYQYVLYNYETRNFVFYSLDPSQ